MLDSGYSILVARGSKIKTPVFVFNYAEVFASVFAPEGLRRDTR
jgi:hypothetical protein